MLEISPRKVVHIIFQAREKNWAEAEACFARALEQWRTTGDTWNLANTLGELAGLHLAQGDGP